MKRDRSALRLFGSVVALAIGGMASSAGAALLTYEPFNYTVGQGLSGLTDGQTYGTGGQVNNTNGYNNTWYPRATTGLGSTYSTANDAVIASGSLSYTGLASSSGQSTTYGQGGYSPNLGWLNNTAAVTSPSPTAGDGISSGSVYYSMIFNVSDVSTLVPRGFIAAFNNGNGSTATGNPSSAPASLWILKSLVSRAVENVNYEIGIGKSNTSDAAAWDGINHTVGDTVFVVAKYNFNTGSTTDDTVQLYINPDASTFGNDGLEGALQQAALGPSTAGGGADVGANPAGSIPSIKSLFLRQAGTGVIVPSVQVDEVRVGTTWADVTPGIPEPSSAALIAVALGGLLKRRRRD